MVDNKPGVREAARAERARLLRHLVDEVLVLKPAAKDVFTASPAAHVFDRVYGGQLMAQALMAAAATADARSMHSAHCYFLRMGDPKLPLEFKVERVRDTRSFSNRVVRVEQAGACLMLLNLSFCLRQKGGITHQWPMPDTPPPEELLSRDEVLLTLHDGALPKNAGIPWPIDIRYVDRSPWDDTASDGGNRLWMRPEGKLPDSPLLHTCLLLYASDQAMFEPVIARHAVRWQDLIAARGMFGASLDHAFWLHEDFRFDDWLLHVQESSRAADGRGFSSGRFYSKSGALVASVAQEIFIKSIESGSDA